MYNYNLDYISHHGVKGQKWGVKNGPPYPLAENKKVLLKKGTTAYRVTNVGKETNSRKL